MFGGEYTVYMLLGPLGVTAMLAPTIISNAVIIYIGGSR